MQKAYAWVQKAFIATTSTGDGTECMKEPSVQEIRDDR